jgi:ABC-type nitrate/sulfonate/bicarbonate transport system substrate-binding protein
LIAGFLVRKDSPYQSVVDLKGKKVTGKFPGTKPLHWDGVGLFATADMKWDDVIVVPVGNIVEGIQTFIQGRAESTLVAVATGLVQEADAALKGVRFLTIPAGGDVARKMWNAVPAQSRLCTGR